MHSKCPVEGNEYINNFDFFMRSKVLNFKIYKINFFIFIKINFILPTKIFGVVFYKKIIINFFIID